MTGFSDSDNSTQDQYNKEIKNFKKNGVKLKKGVKLDLMQKMAKMEVKEKKKAKKQQIKIEDEQINFDNGNKSANVLHESSIPMYSVQHIRDQTTVAVNGSKHQQKASEIYQI